MNNFSIPAFATSDGYNSSDTFGTKQSNDNNYSLLMINSIRSNNERLLPSGEELMDKKFYVGIWCYIQAHSKCNHTDGFRYISDKDLSATKISAAICNLSKGKGSDVYFHKPLDRKNVSTKINYLKDKKYILEKVDGSVVGEGYSGTYYRIKNEDAFKYYILLENEYLESLYSGLSQDALKLYFLYYSFNTGETEGECFLNQDEILKRIGLTTTGANYEKLRFLNHHLKQLGLIKVYKKIDRTNGRKTKEKNITIAPFYWKTSYYINLKGKKTTYDNVTYEYIEL